MRLDDLGAGAHVDVRNVVQLLDQVIRHRLDERLAPDEQGHRLSAAAEIGGGLAGRIRAADDVDIVLGAIGRLGQRRTVEHAPTGQLLGPLGIELTVRNAGRENHRVRADRIAVGESDRARWSIYLEPDDVAGGDELGAEFHRLPPRAISELRARYAVGKAEVVLDARTLPGLPAGGDSLDQHRPQSLGRAVHR